MKNQAVVAVLVVALTTALLSTCLGCALTQVKEPSKLELYCLAQHAYFQLEEQKALQTELQYMNNSF
jgi:hypothetical protein